MQFIGAKRPFKTFPASPTIKPHQGPRQYAVKKVPKASSQSGSEKEDAKAQPKKFAAKLKRTKKEI